MNTELLREIFGGEPKFIELTSIHKDAKISAQIDKIQTYYEDNPSSDFSLTVVVINQSCSHYVTQSYDEIKQMIKEAWVKKICYKCDKEIVEFPIVKDDDDQILKGIVFKDKNGENKVDICKKCWDEE